MLSSILNFQCVMGSVFIYIIKFIIEINTAIKLEQKNKKIAPLVFLSASARGSAASILGH